MSGAQRKLNSKLCIVQLAKATKAMEAAMAGEAQVRRDQEAEREKVKRAITDLRRKLDRRVQLPGGIKSCNCMWPNMTAPASHPEVLGLGARRF